MNFDKLLAALKDSTRWVKNIPHELDFEVWKDNTTGKLFELKPTKGAVYYGGVELPFEIFVAFQHMKVNKMRLREQETLEQLSEAYK